MRYKFFIIFYILFIFNLFSEEKVNSKDIDSKYYGIKTIFNYKNDYNEYINFQNNFFTFIDDIRNGKKNISEISKYFSEINYNTIKGICINDSILLYLFPKYKNEIIHILENYIKKDVSNKYEIEKLINLLSNPNLENLSPYSFSTMQSMMKLDKILLLIPSNDWEKMKNGNSSVYILGDKFASCAIVIKKTIINKKYDILNDKNLNIEFLIQSKPNEKNEGFYSLLSNKITKISDEIQIGDFNIKSIYERITVTPDKYYYVNFVERTRYYIKDNILISISLATTIAGLNILRDKENLIYIQGLILDSVSFLKI